MSLDQIINLQIDRQTATVSQQGFGTILILGEHTVFTERFRAYNDPAALISDGFAVSDPEYIHALNAFSQDNRPTQVLVGRKDGAESYVDAITAIRVIVDDWYGLVIDSHADADILAVAAFVEGIGKLFGASTASADAIDPANTTDVVSVLQDNGYARTFTIYHADAATEQPESAIMGDRFPTDPGTSTWKFKNLRGIPVSDELTPTQVNALIAKNCNFYKTCAGNGIFQEGVLAGGEFIDIIRASDWLKARIQEDIFGELIRQEKISFTDAGITAIDAIIKQRLAIAVDRDVLAPNPAPATIVPKALDLPVNDRAQRCLNEIKFMARFAGAIHKLDIDGTVTV